MYIVEVRDDSGRFKYKSNAPFMGKFNLAKKLLRALNPLFSAYYPSLRVIPFSPRVSVIAVARHARD